MIEEFKNLCEKIRSKVHPSLTWEWDDRFGSTLMVFTIGQSKDIYSFLSGEFAESWNSDTISKAPTTVKTLAEQIFGIRYGQLLFSMNPKDMVVVFAAWWPWENEKDISLRIGMRPIEGSQYSEEDLEKFLRSWFRISS